MINMITFKLEVVCNSNISSHRTRVIIKIYYEKDYCCPPPFSFSESPLFSVLSMNGQEASERSNLITNDSLSVSYDVISSASSSVSMSDQLQRPTGNIQNQLGATTNQYAKINILGNVSVCLKY